MPGNHAAVAAVCALVAVSCCAPAAAQQHPALKRVTLSSLTAQGFEIKAAVRDAVMLQKGAEVYWCTLRLAEGSPISYQSDCFSVR
jgi:hypothetical protein